MIVRCRGLSKAFATRRTWAESLRSFGAAPRRRVVSDVSFEVAAGEIFGLLGQNGAGKTTLFRMLATLLTPDAGSAEVDGHDVAHDGAAVREAIAPVLANERSLYWRLSARENLRLFAVLQGLHGATRDREVARVLAAVGLESTGAAMVGGFSSGMRQRLLIARALLGRPRILLLDEPTRSLDPISARDFRHFLRTSIVAAEGCTVLLATHDADDVWDLCDRVAVLERGRLLAVDRASTLRQRVGAAMQDLVVRADDEAAARALLAAQGLQVHGATADEDGWIRLLADATGSAGASAELLQRFHAAQLPVARAALRPATLADLIERVVRSAEGAHG
jgi:ABC-2 type transport system ATP-binding protein